VLPPTGPGALASSSAHEPAVPHPGFPGQVLLRSLCAHLSKVLTTICASATMGVKEPHISVGRKTMAPLAGLLDRLTVRRRAT